MNKQVLKLVFLGLPAAILGLFFIIGGFEKETDEMRHAPVINYWRAISVDVKTIDFERNGLYLNDTVINAEGISGYSRVYKADTVYELEEIKPPFAFKKEKNNDTIKIIKSDKEFYLLVSEGVRRNKEDK